MERKFKFQRRTCKLSFLIFSCFAPKLAPKRSGELQPWTKQMENLYPPASPQIKSEKMACFGFCAASSLISGGGWGFAFPFCPVQDCCSPCTNGSRDSAVLVGPLAAILESEKTLGTRLCGLVAVWLFRAEKRNEHA